MTPRHFPLLITVAGAAALAVVLAGCGKDGADNAPSTTPPATIIPKPANATQNAPPPSTPAPAGTSNPQPK